MNIRKIRRQIHFHSKQRWAITIIILLIIFVIVYGRISKMNHKKSNYDDKEHYKILALLKDEADLNKLKSTRSKVESKLHPKNFNPNTVTVKQLTSMGITKRNAKSWIKYTSKGGKFHKPEDLKKLYSMNDKIYNQLEPFLHIPRRNSNSRRSKDNKNNSHINGHQNKYNPIKKDNNVFDYKNQNQVVEIDSIDRKKYNEKFKKTKNKKRSGISDHYIIEINKTDSLELQILEGIGPVLSSRIIKYRDKLGGFHNMNQLLEVYGVKPILITNIINHLGFKGDLKKININTITLDELVKHPYFDYQTANIFINYRSHHGDYKSVTDIKKIRVIKDYWLEEIEPYFSYKATQ